MGNILQIKVHAFCSYFGSSPKVRSGTMSFGKLTDGFQADFTAALALQGKKPTNEVFQECMKVLKDHKVSYTVVAKPAYFLVHKENRGRLMLSPHNAHRNC